MAKMGTGNFFRRSPMLVHVAVQHDPANPAAAAAWATCGSAGGTGWLKENGVRSRVGGGLDSVQQLLALRDPVILDDNLDLDAQFERRYPGRRRLLDLVVLVVVRERQQENAIFSCSIRFCIKDTLRYPQRSHGL